MNTYEARQAGRDYCNTEGSEHYKGGGVEPLDYIFAQGYGEGFCIGSIIKYASRYKKTRNPDDLKKISDYAQILCGVELSDEKTPKKLCMDRRESGRECEECPAGKRANEQEMTCREFILSFPAQARKLLEGETHGR